MNIILKCGSVFSPISPASRGNEAFNTAEARTQLSAYEDGQIQIVTSDACVEETVVKYRHSGNWWYLKFIYSGLTNKSLA